MEDSELYLQTERAKNDALCLRTLEEYGLRRTQTGYYYIAHYYPLRAMQPVSSADAQTLIEPLAGDTFETYLHFPFCEVKCSFCHFYKDLARKDYEERQEELISALEAEMQLYASVLGRIRARSFYIGGGTPSLMTNRQLSRLLRSVRKHLDIIPGAETKFELFPKIYEPNEIREKLLILKDFGFTDLVIDLESGNQRSLDFVGRSNTSLDAYLRLVELCVEFGFDSIVTGLIIGLPYETFKSLQRTATALMAIPEVKVVNTFPLITRHPDPIYQQLKQHPEFFHDAESRDALWIFIQDVFRSRGFKPGPISYLNRPGKRPNQQADKFECVNLLGFGPSAFGYWNGADWAAQYFNYCNREQYFRRIQSGELPVWRCGVMGQEERARRKLIFGLANCKTENLIQLEKTYGVSVDLLVGRELNALLELGLIEVDSEEAGIRYTRRGLSRLEEVSYFLGSEYVKNHCTEPEHEDPNRMELLRHHYYINITQEDRILFEDFACKQSPHFMWRYPQPARGSNTQILRDYK